MAGNSSPPWSIKILKLIIVSQEFSQVSNVHKSEARMVSKEIVPQTLHWVFSVRGAHRSRTIVKFEPEKEIKR